MKNILIFGASGHSKMIIDSVLKSKSYNIIGFIDTNKPIGMEVYNYKIIGDINTIETLIKEHDIYGFVIGVGDNYTRKLIYQKISKLVPEVKFVPVVHPSAVLANDVIITEGTVIMPGAIVNAGAKLGAFCLLNTKSSLGHDSSMADFSSLASGVTIGGNVSIGECSAICLGASIINNVSIGHHTVIGAGALVIDSIGDFKQATGAPVKRVKERAIDSKYLER